MKKVILSLAIVAVAIVGVKAQTSGGSAKVKLNVILNPVLSIEIGNKSGDVDPSGNIGDANDVVNLEYKTAEDYQKGVQKTVNGQLKVTSIGSNFKLFAQTSDNNLKRVEGGNETLAGDLVTIAINGKEKNVRDLVSQQDYGTIDGKSTTAKELDVTYHSGILDDAKLENLLRNNNKDKVVYTTNVVYSVIPQ
jgi:hypothetical protein